MEAPFVQSGSIARSKGQGPRREQQQSLKYQALLNAFVKHHPSLRLPEAVGFLGNYSNANRPAKTQILMSVQLPTNGRSSSRGLPALAGRQI